MLTHHQVAVNPQAGLHSAPLRCEKMRCNPPSMKSAFLLFSSTALLLVFLPLLSAPPPTNPQPFQFLQLWIIERILHISYTNLLKHSHVSRFDRSILMTKIKCGAQIEPRAHVCSAFYSASSVLRETF